MILIWSHLHTDDFDFDFKSFMYTVISILIWNHFTSDFTHHWNLYNTVADYSNRKHKHTELFYTVSKNCANLFLSELHQIYSNFDNFWQKDGKKTKIMQGIFISHLT